jgi:hypothetical protein
VAPLLFPIIILIVAIVKAFASARRDAGNLPPPGPFRPTESDAERQRRFREAVGLPPGADLPPPVRPRTSANPPPLQPIQPAGARPFPGTPGRLRRAAPAPPSPVNTPRTLPPAGRAPAAPAPAKVSPAPVAVAPATPVRQAAPPARPAAAPVAAVSPSYTATALLPRLRNPSAIREAIILREVLGPPKALQPG